MRLHCRRRACPRPVATRRLLVLHTVNHPRRPKPARRHPLSCSRVEDTHLVSYGVDKKLELAGLVSPAVRRQGEKDHPFITGQGPWTSACAYREIRDALLIKPLDASRPRRGERFSELAAMLRALSGHYGPGRPRRREPLRAGALGEGLCDVRGIGRPRQQRVVPRAQVRQCRANDLGHREPAVNIARRAARRRG